MSLDPEDFQRIQVLILKIRLSNIFILTFKNFFFIFQANLIELKDQNYSLQDQCRKQKNGKML